MGITETAIIYGLIGAVVAAAMWMANPAGAPGGRVISFGLHLVLWPFFAPTLLGRVDAVGSEAAGSNASAAPARSGRSISSADTGAYGQRVRTARDRLVAALASLDGMAREVFDGQRAHVDTLTDSLDDMAGRLAEMEALLATPEFDAARARAALDAIDADVDDDPRGRRDGRAASVRARLGNIERLSQMRRTLSRDFERAILKVEEISSQIRLLGFAERPEDQVSGLIDEINATVEGFSESLLST